MGKRQFLLKCPDRVSRCHPIPLFDLPPFPVIVVALSSIASAMHSATPPPDLSHTPLQRGYEPDWLGNTFSIAVFLGNGLVAIVAGLLAHGLVEVRRPGAASPSFLP